LRGEFPNANPEVVKIFQDLVALAETYKYETRRYLQIWGELGELYAEIKFGVVRHRPGTQGSDGRISDDWVEVKTISPEKLDEVIQVKRAGNFNKLLIVKDFEDFEFEARMIDSHERARASTPSCCGESTRARRPKTRFRDRPEAVVRESRQKRSLDDNIDPKRTLRGLPSAPRRARSP